MQLRAEKATQLEIEVRRYKEKEQHFTDASDKIKAKYEDTKKKLDKAEEELSKLRSQGEGGSSSAASNLLQKMSRESRGGSNVMSLKPKFGKI